MDVSVLVLAVVLNPRAKRRAGRADQTGRIETRRGCDGDGGENRGGVTETVMPMDQQGREKGSCVIAVR